MRICFFADARNGHLQRLAPGLAEHGHDVHVVCHKPEVHDWPAGVTVEKFRIPQAGLSRPYRWQSRWKRYLGGFLTAFDVVVVFFLHDWGFTPEIAQKGCLIASPRGSDIVPPPGENPPSQELIDKRMALLRGAALVGVAGPSFARMVADFASLDVRTIGSLPLGVDLDRFRPVERSESNGSPVRRVGFLKGFRPVYGAVDLVAAVPQVIAEIPDVEFELVGDGPDFSKCHTMARELGVSSSIVWVGRRPHADVPGLLSAWNLTAMPSRCESFGLAALESSAMCVPVVASKVGGVADVVVDGVTGRLVPQGVLDVLADAIVDLLRDPLGLREMGRAGREFVRRRFEWHSVLTTWEQTLQQALDRVAVMA